MTKQTQLPALTLHANCPEASRGNPTFRYIIIINVTVVPNYRSDWPGNGNS